MRFKLPILTLGILAMASLAKAVPTISVSGYQLLVCGTPFLARGMNYKPTPNSGPYDWGDDWSVDPALVEADLDKMAQMGINTIRVYVTYERLFNDWSAAPNLNNPAGDTVDPTTLANYNTLLAYAAGKGVYVIMDYWVPYNQDYVGNTTLRSYEELRFRKIIDTFKNLNTYPNVLMWAFGNENNLAQNMAPLSSTQMFSFFNEALSDAKALSDTTHTYTVPLVDNGDLNNPSLTNLLPTADVWSMNIYQFGLGYDNIISNYDIPKPFLFTEFGNDAYDANSGSEDQADQAAFFADRWDNHIGPNLSALDASQKLVGACAFEWNDEWWKCGNNTVHDTCGYAGNMVPDNVVNEEWFGISDALPGGSAGPRVYRSAAATLQSIWTNPPYNIAGPNCTGPTSTPTPTETPGSPTATLTSTATPNPCAISFDNFNSGSGTDQFGGLWGHSEGTGGTGSLSFTSAGYLGNGMSYTYTVPSSGSYAVIYGPTNAGADPAGNGTNPRDLSGYGRIIFYAKSTTAKTYFFKIASNVTNLGGGGYNWWQASFNVGTSWAPVTLDFNNTVFSNPGGNKGTLLQNLQNATQINFDDLNPDGTGTTLSIDEIVLVPSSCIPTSTPTATPTNAMTTSATASQTPTNTPTQTGTSTATSSATSTASFTMTATPSRTATATPSPTLPHTATATPTPTVPTTPTASMTVTPSFTATATVTAPPSFTSTRTFTATPSSTPSPSPFPTGTGTATATASRTQTPVSTSSWTPSSTPTGTATSPPTPANTATGTPLVTATPSPTSIGTTLFTPSPTPSTPSSSTPTASLTATPTDTMTASATTSQTPTNTPTQTGTSTATSSATSTASFTPSWTPSHTASSTATPSPIPTNTASATPSFTPSSTATASTTATASATSTATRSFTPTASRTFSPTPTSNFIPVIYPNPSSGGPVTLLLPVSKATAEVKVQLFTTAFRKVQEKDFASIPNGRMTLYMEDTWGNPLASGLYYVVVVEEGRRFMTKLLLLR